METRSCTFKHLGNIAWLPVHSWLRPSPAFFAKPCIFIHRYRFKCHIVDSCLCVCSVAFIDSEFYISRSLFISMDTGPRRSTMWAFHSLAFYVILCLILSFSATTHATAENNDVVENPVELAHPEQVHLSLGDKPDQMVVTWVTMTKRKSRLKVQENPFEWTTLHVGGGSNSRFFFILLRTPLP